MTDPRTYPSRPPGVKVGRAQNRGWGPGWPDCQADAQVTIERDDGLRLPIRREIAWLVALLMDETERRGYDIEPGHTGGFNCRAIRQTRQQQDQGKPKRASNHSWGLAVDINWRRNPHRDHLVSDMPPWMPGLWWDHLFFWGGWYRNRPDAMHYEFLGTPDDATRLTQRARDQFGDIGTSTVTTEPSTGGGMGRQRFETPNQSAEPGERTLRRFSAGADVRVVQVALGLTDEAADGLFGSRTERAVKEFQRQHGLLDDGIVGPATWNAILGRLP